MVSLDVERGRVAVARVRTGVSTRHRRLEEGQVGRGKKAFLFRMRVDAPREMHSLRLGTSKRETRVDELEVPV